MELANKYASSPAEPTGCRAWSMGPLLGQFEFDLRARVASIYSVAVLFVAFLVLRRLVHSPFGITLKAIRDNRLRATAIGLSVNGRLAVVYTLRRGAGRRCRRAGWHRPPALPRSTCSSSTARPM